MDLKQFLFYNIIFICIITYSVYYFFARNNSTFIQFLNNNKDKKKINLKKMVVGFTFGFVFGFIDNFGFGIGFSNLDKFLDCSHKMKGLIANTYSDIIGAIIGTLVSVIVDKLWKVDVEKEYGDLPIYINAISIGFGCIFGIFIVKIFFKK